MVIIIRPNLMVILIL